MIRSVPPQAAQRSISNLFGGTAWWFSAENGPNVDMLIVDEAGQVSLGHLVGMASAAGNVVLADDPLQLPQPSKGSHPRASGRSCLEHAIGGSGIDRAGTTSDAESMPRDASFLLSRNRLNVAIGRARCLR